METENTYVLYAAKRESGKWLSRSDPDVTRYLEGGEVPASIRAMMSAENQLSFFDELNEHKFKFPIGGEVKTGDFHVIVEPVKDLKVKPLNTRTLPLRSHSPHLVELSLMSAFELAADVEAEHNIRTGKGVVWNTFVMFTLYCIFIRGNVPICLADDQLCVSRTMSILLAFLLVMYLMALALPTPVTKFVQNKLFCPVLMQYGRGTRLIGARMRGSPRHRHKPRGWDAKRGVTLA